MRKIAVVAVVSAFVACAHGPSLSSQGEGVQVVTSMPAGCTVMQNLSATAEGDTPDEARRHVEIDLRNQAGKGGANRVFIPSGGQPPQSGKTVTLNAQTLRCP